jgi:N6-L-threonylcarbamoyladenine synthase
VSFPPAQLKHPDRKGKGGRGDGPYFDFSYSGIKTAVLRYVEVHNMKEGIERRRAALASLPKPTIDDYLALSDKRTLDLIASFQRAMVEDLIGKTLVAADACGAETLFVTGGVAANRELRESFERAAAMQGVAVFFPSRPLSTDNAAMIAAAAYPKFVAGDFAGADFSAEAGLQLK